LEKTFLGGPIEDFDRVGQLCVEVLLREGLLPSSRVLDVGCGALRVGYWLMRLLDPGCYYGIEPNKDMLNTGLQELVEPEVVERALAHFAHNDDFDFSVFGAQFDFVLARSIWTHTPKRYISAMLSSFAQTAAPKGVLLATYHPASAVLAHTPTRLRRRVITLPLNRLSPAVSRMRPLQPSRDYLGDDWVGRSHESDESGVVNHSLHWISNEAHKHNLSVVLERYTIINSQFWLRITRAS
jgi:SAM-dependent methyltransferase